MGWLVIREVMTTLTKRIKGKSRGETVMRTVFLTMLWIDQAIKEMAVISKIKICFWKEKKSVVRGRKNMGLRINPAERAVKATSFEYLSQVSFISYPLRFLLHFVKEKPSFVLIVNITRLL